MNNLTIIIPVFNEERYIMRLLKVLSTIRAGSEVLVIDGCSNDLTNTLVQNFIDSSDSKGPHFRLLRNPARLQAHALNIGLQAAVNSICLRLDGHLLIPSECNIQKEIDQLFTIIESTQEYCAAGFKQRFIGNGIIASAVALLSSTPFLSGFSPYRYATQPCNTYNTAWLFYVNKNLAIEVGGFDPRTTPNEDQNFNRRLIAHTGKPMLIYPQLPLYYQPRSTLKDLARQYFNYGQARARSSILTQRGRDKLLLITAALAHLLSTLVYMGAIIAIPAAYLSSLMLITSCNAICIASDRLHYLRNTSLPKPHPLVLITALVLSPLLATVPSLARAFGTLRQFTQTHQSVSNNLTTS
jgi:succinoglycan biosynthesis protein ExoA